MAFHYNPRIVTDGLTFYFDGANVKSYSGSGSTVNDLTKNGNNGTITNSPTYNSDGYWTFDGTTEYMSIPSEDEITNFSENNNYTVSFWFNPASTQNYTVNNDNDVVEKWNGGAGYPYVFRYYRSNESIQAAVWDGSSGEGISLSISSDTWWHITGVFNWSSSQLKLYTNGGYHNTNSRSLSKTGISNNHVISIMRRGNGTNYTTGDFSSLMVYNRALTDNEVKQNFHATRGRFGL